MNYLAPSPIAHPFANGTFEDEEEKRMHFDVMAKKAKDSAMIQNEKAEKISTYSSQTYQRLNM